MEKTRINVEKASEIKTLWHVGYLYSQRKNEEVILEFPQSYEYPPILLVTYATLAEGILNSDETKPRREVNTENMQFNKFEDVTRELTKITGLRFSHEVIEKPGN